MNLPFSYYASFLNVSATTVISKEDSSGDQTIYMISYISSFEIIRAVIPNPRILLCIPADAADAAADAAVNPNGI